jgi:DNA-binding NarL/FixJ family response regulator
MLVEDSPVLAHRLRELLDQLPDLNLVGTVDSEKAAIQAASDTDLDVMILDLHLKQGTGFGVLRATKDLCKRPVVIILTNYALPQYRTEANMLGVRYFLDKAREFERLADVLHEIAHPAKPPSN